jgi:hypothetical protein
MNSVVISCCKMPKRAKNGQFVKAPKRHKHHAVKKPARKHRKHHPATVVAKPQKHRKQHAAVVAKPRKHRKQHAAVVAKPRKHRKQHAAVVAKPRKQQRRQKRKMLSTLSTVIAKLRKPIPRLGRRGQGFKEPTCNHVLGGGFTGVSLRGLAGVPFLGHHSH